MARRSDRQRRVTYPQRCSSRIFGRVWSPNLSTETKDPTMTDEMMSLRTLLEKSSDADLLREMVGFAAQRLMELEVESLTGAAHRERSPAAETWRTIPSCRQSSSTQAVRKLARSIGA